MREAIVQSIDNLRANKLRSFLTMFGIMWGMVAVVILSATGEGFRQGNEHVLQELGRNVAIVWGNRTSMQTGGERAGRRIRLTVDDARAIAAESSMVSVVSPELERGGVSVKSLYNAANVRITGVEPPYQGIRTIEVAAGRTLSWTDEAQRARVAVIGHDIADQLFGRRQVVGESIAINGLPYTVVGRIRNKEQDSNYNGPDNNKIFVPFSTMIQDLPRTDAPADTVSDIVVGTRPEGIQQMAAAVDRRAGRIEDIEWPLAGNIRAILARRHGFDPADRDALNVWDTSIESLMFDRMIQRMRDFFVIVGLVTLALGGIGVMNIMLVAVRERTREIGVRKALGATTQAIQRQFFLEGFFLAILSGGIGMVLALGLCALVNLAPMPQRFAGMIVSPQSGLFAFGVLLLVAVVASTYPARRAAELTPVDALRFET